MRTRARPRKPLGVSPVEVPGIGIPSTTDLTAPLPRAVHRAQELYVNLGSAGDCPLHTDVRHLIFTDLSGSLGAAGLTGNDPAGLRHAAVLRCAEKIASACTCGREALQVISFDQTSDFDVGPCALNPAGLKELRTALSSTNIGWGISTAGPSLATARAQVADFDGKVTLTMMSDFLLTDTATAIDEIADFPADSLHALVLTAPPPAMFDHHPQISVTTAGWTDDPAIVAEAVYAEFTKFRPPSKPRSPRRAKRRSRR